MRHQEQLGSNPANCSSETDTNQGKTTHEDHEYDEGLEIVVLDQLEHEESVTAPDLADGGPVKGVEYETAFTDATLWAALVGVLYEYHFHLGMRD